MNWQHFNHLCIISNICRLLWCENLLLFFVIYDSYLNRFGRLAGRNKPLEDVTLFSGTLKFSIFWHFMDKTISRTYGNTLSREWRLFLCVCDMSKMASRLFHAASVLQSAKNPACIEGELSAVENYSEEKSLVPKASRIEQSWAAPCSGNTASVMWSFSSIPS